MRFFFFFDNMIDSQTPMNVLDSVLTVYTLLVNSSS